MALENKDGALRDNTPHNHSWLPWKFQTFRMKKILQYKTRSFRRTKRTKVSPLLFKLPPPPLFKRYSSNSHQHLHANATFFIPMRARDWHHLIINSRIHHIINQPRYIDSFRVDRRPWSPFSAFFLGRN